MCNLGTQIFDFGAAHAQRELRKSAARFRQTAVMHRGSIFEFIALRLANSLEEAAVATKPLDLNK